MKQLELGLDIEPAVPCPLPAPEVIENPLGFWGWTTPDYITTDSLEGFIAYGFLTSWLDEDNCSFSDQIDGGYIKDLREAFLQSLEWVAWELWAGNVNPGDRDFDWANFDHLYVSNEDDKEDGDTYLVWGVEFIEDDKDNDNPAICMQLHCDDGADNNAIYLSLKAIQDKQHFLGCITHARRVNRIGNNSGYEAEGIYNPYGDYLDYLKTTNDPKGFSNWYKYDWRNFLWDMEASYPYSVMLCGKGHPVTGEE